jgi:DNA modification methylase
MDIFPILKDKEFELCLTDPPYNVNIQYNTHNDNNLNYSEWSLKWFNEALRISNCLVFTPGMVNLKFWYENTNPKWLFCWYKNNQNSPSALGGFNIWEPILIYGKNKKRIGQDGFDIKIGMQKEAAFHPVPKSLKAWSRIIELFTDENDSIIDPFSGSGTTAISCNILNRNFLAIEKDADYWKASVERYNTEINQGKLF